MDPSAIKPSAIKPSAWERTAMDHCVICDEADGIGTPLAYQDEVVSVFPARWQPVGNPGYMLFVTREHIPTLYDLGDGLVGPVLRRLRDVASAVQQAAQADGTTILQNNNPPGQELMHMHVHIVPRFHGDDYWNAATPELDPIAREAQAVALRHALGPGGAQGS